MSTPAPIRAIRIKVIAVSHTTDRFEARTGAQGQGRLISSSSITGRGTHRRRALGRFTRTIQAQYPGVPVS